MTMEDFSFDSKVNGLSVLAAAVDVVPSSTTAGQKRQRCQLLPEETGAPSQGYTANNPNGSNSIQSIIKHPPIPPQVEGESDVDYRRRKQREYSRRSYEKKRQQKASRAAFQFHILPPSSVTNSAFDFDTPNAGPLSPILQTYLGAPVSSWPDMFHEDPCTRVLTVVTFVNEKDSQKIPMSPQLAKLEVPGPWQLCRQYHIEVRTGKDDEWQPWFRVAESQDHQASQQDHPESTTATTPMQTSRGLFAMRSFRKQECIGLYMGQVRPYGMYCRSTNTGTGMAYYGKEYPKWIVDPSLPITTNKRRPVYFGIHYAKDPFLEHPNGDVVNRSEVDVYNIQILPDMRCVAKRDIQVGEELLLDYRWDKTVEVVS